MWSKIDILSFKVTIHNEDGENVKSYLNEIIISEIIITHKAAQISPRNQERIWRRIPRQVFSRPVRQGLPLQSSWQCDDRYRCLFQRHAWVCQGHCLQ